jgi:hypothetical protein
LELEQTLVFCAFIHGWGGCQTQIVAAAMAQRDRLGITGKQVKVDNRATVVTAIQQTPVMLGADRDKGQTPVPPKVGIDIGLQTMGAILKPGLAAGESVHGRPQKPRRPIPLL